MHIQSYTHIYTCMNIHKCPHTYKYLQVCIFIYTYILTKKH